MVYLFMVAMRNTKPPVKRIPFAKYQQAIQVIIDFRNQSQADLDSAKAVQTAIKHNGATADDSMDNLDISVRLWNLLHAGKFVKYQDGTDRSTSNYYHLSDAKIRDLSTVSFKDFLKRRGAGKSTLEELKAILNHFELPHRE